MKNVFTNEDRYAIMTISHMTNGHDLRGGKILMPKSTFFNLPEEKKDKIIAVAIDEFAQNHYEKVTINKIVKQAEIPKGSFYQYFENKDDVYIFLFSQIGNSKKNNLEELKDRSSQLDFKSYVMLLLEAGNQFGNEDLRILELKNRFINECPQEIRKKILSNEFPKSYQLLADVIRLYIKKGELRENLDVEMVAYIVTQGLANIEFYQNAGSSIKDLGRRILDVVIEGIQTESGGENKKGE
ncbi:TetR/AcrR family transcriptional regulator [Acetobacterium sp. K1/6]|uniref:TetR/AcrR family transcriptional regulator n=1 Tax=Acetobacterium sp. K1/6 TaxID=3055467 RepID=UPI002ACACDF7|nr:TetR/AcrR family transcriptional regulator [Acetobacterium sp. K1/6]MDZ5724405.1 TetR/AcrR family transcriptional regulator [Acetobacterium sp. K1/6]